MIQAYLPSNTDYEHNGDMTLFPSSASVHAILNGSWEADLVHPIDQEGRWKFIQQEGVVSMPSFYENSTTLPQMQLFRIKAVDKSDTEIVATMEPIFYDAMDDCFLTDIRPTDKNGQQALDILCAVNTKYSGKSNITKTSTAYYQYKNLLEALNGDTDNSFISRWGGEMLFNDYEVIINDHVGSDSGYELRYGKNMPVNGLTESVDIRDVVTRIYPKAYNGREMSNHGYVDSELIDSYPTVKAVTMTFDNVKLAEDANADDEENGVIICDTQAELDQALTEQCEAQFASGVDKPKVTISANLVILKYSEQYKEYSMLEDVSLGDTIHCINSRLGIETSARVIELEYDSLRKKVKSVVIGDYQYNYFDNVTSSAGKIEQIVLPNGKINAAVVQGIIDAANAQFRIQNTAAQKVEQRAILFEDLDPNSSLFGALSIGTQGIQIAHERTADGRDWDWGTAINYRMINADYIIAGTITDQKANNFWNLNTGEFRLSASTIEDNSLATIEETIASVDVEYASGTSDTEAPADGWSTTAPKWQEGRYIWQRTVTTMADGTKNISDPACIQGAAGESVSVITTSVTYAVSSSGVTPPSTWSETIPDTSPGQYLWSKSETVYSDGKETVSYGVSYQGENGADGENGTNGTDGINGTDGTDGIGIVSSNVDYQVSDSGVTPPTGDWSDTVPDMEPGQFLWTRTQFTYTDGDVTTSYSVSYQGENGSQGVPGPPGKNGQTLYTWIKYADTPTSGMSDTPDGKKYLGIAYNKESPIESGNYEDYQWSDIKGEDGIPGTPGENGETLYTWIKYATDASGSGMSDSPEGRSYIGIAYNKESPEESDSPTDYAWSLIQGEAGIGVKNVVEEYYLSTSSTTQTGGSWSTAQPAWQSGRYIWTRSQITWTDGSTTTTDPVLAQAINSANQNASDAQQAVTELDNELDQQGVFNRLTNNGQTQGIYLSGGKLYINATYIATGRISSTDGKVYFDLNTGTLVASEIVGTEEGSTTNGKIGVLTYSGGETAEGFSVATTSGNGGRVSLLISRGVGDYTLANDAEIITTGNMMLRSNTIATNPGGNNSLIFQGNSSSGQGLIQLWRGKPGGQDNVLYASASTTNLYGLNSQLALFSNSNSTALCFNGNQAINIAQSQIDIRYSGSYVYIVSASNNYVRVGHWSGDASVIMRNNMIDFSVTGYLRASINSDGSASFGTIYSNGNVVTSERSKKKDILPLDDGAIEKIKASSVYKYSLQEEEIKDEESDSARRTALHSKANEEYIGIMYDEAPEELRKENVKGQKGIDLYSMVSLLWKAVQELNDKIERIKSES